MDMRCVECHRLAEPKENTCRACGSTLRRAPVVVYDIREHDLERDTIDLIAAVVAAGEPAPRPPKKFHLAHLDLDPLIDLEGTDLLPATSGSRRSWLRR